ncbi:Transcriptional regulator, AraC family [Candidatus Burkholderia brachyanthoides]|nr:Transcriptional regulator, AraC family [Candidatus Burkholderia brachyanthoides]
MSHAIPMSEAHTGRYLRRTEERKVKLIEIMLYDGFSLLGAGTVAEAFHIANELQTSRQRNGVTYSVRFVSARGHAIACSSSVCVWTERLGGQRFQGFDALYIAGGTGVKRAAADAGLIELLTIACSQSSVVNSLGNGDVLLAATGISRRDWASVERGIWSRETLKGTPSNERYDALITSVALVKRDLGYDIATAVADCLTLANDQHLTTILSTMGTTTLAEKAQESARWLERNCGRPISIGDAARTVAMSERNFLRLFKREMGVTPSQYLLQARLNLSCELLALSDLPIDKIARRTGLTNGERFSEFFRKQFSMSPTEYRLKRKSGVVLESETDVMAYRRAGLAFHRLCAACRRQSSINVAAGVSGLSRRVTTRTDTAGSGSTSGSTARSSPTHGCASSDLGIAASASEPRKRPCAITKLGYSITRPRHRKAAFSVIVEQRLRRVFG